MAYFDVVGTLQLSGYFLEINIILIKADDQKMANTMNDLEMHN